MNDFKTCGCKPSLTSLTIDDDYGRRLSLSSSFAKPSGLIIDCTEVTFRLKELDININGSKTKEYLENIDVLTINGIKFIKLESEENNK